ncbi:hypothetical protein BBD40_17750 [Paenibacillus ihbetae]|uniref:Uncharacterized protein n=1 Tax=Paenibacillus ihbetae TaxID=1870820 RepID=A0ABX3K268_9BACL|nr:hypothetical protein BBD40_17750 [Paenibacillus ihbetae]
MVVEGFRGPRIIDLRHSGFPHDGYIHEDVDTMAYKKRLPDDSGSGVYRSWRQSSWRRRFRST